MIRPADPISPELNELEKFTLEQRAKMNATSPRQEYMDYRLTPEYWRQRRLDGIRIAEDARDTARDTARREAAEESRKAAIKSWVALGLSVTAAAVSALSLFLR